MFGSNNNTRKRPAEQKQQQPPSHQTRTFQPTSNSFNNNMLPTPLPTPPPPPSNHGQTQQQPSFTNTKIENNEKKKNQKSHTSFLPAVQHLARPLVPLVSITTGRPHPDFPRTILSYHLLNSSQLDDLARHYHQVWPPVPETFGYPLRVPAWIGTNNEHEVDIETKRRRFGRFVGLRGCESPVEYSAAPWGGGNSLHHGSGGANGADNDDDVSTEIENGNETDMEMLDRMERMWEEALRRARGGDADMVLIKKAGGV
ncbi:hypothetical protein VTN00DRAFT_2767 [Thermoascus crustaceus]|uniref:uncharacterized protein n=1 Tax=Thermoascus crustaceus TaxID=5088 RepID=UPI0037443031